VESVGVVGLGVVGGTVAQAFREAGLVIVGYDPYLDIGKPEDFSGCAVVFLCVSTPLADDGSHDLTEIWRAVHEIEPYLDDGAVVTIKSTVPPGTCSALESVLPRLRFAVAPEFLVAGDPLQTFTAPDRIVVGSSSGEVAALVAELLSRVAPTAPVVVLDSMEAELVKVCSNAMLAAKVSLANELAEVCHRFGVAWPRVQGAVGLDRRIGPDHLAVSEERGFGGACLPKDLDGLIAASKQAGYDAPLLEQIARFNRRIRKEESLTGAPDLDGQAEGQEFTETPRTSVPT
jgi:UDPglucose 6-dehydrogenase